jgi:diguanylate cyclase (GGDEF)-like protein/PAS domain S-box-containing protein
MAERFGADVGQVGRLGDPMFADVTSREFTPARCEDALGAILEGHPGAVIAALNDHGFRIPVPVSLELGGRQTLPVPVERSTMVDVVVPADRLTVVTTWERAQSQGLAVRPVRSMSDPDRWLTLSIIDAHRRHGVWLAVLTDDDTATTDTGLEAVPLVMAMRPRSGAMHKNMLAMITAIDANISKMLGFSAEEMIGVRSSEFVHPDDQDRAVAAWMQLIYSGVGQRVRFRHRRSDGTWLWVEADNLHNGADDGDQIDITAYVTDVSDEMAAHEEIAHREQLFSRLAAALPTGVAQLGQGGEVVYANERLAAILGTHPTNAACILDAVTEQHRPGFDASLTDALIERRDSEAEYDVIRPADGQRRCCTVSFVAVDDQNGRPGALLCVSDVTDSAAMRDKLRALATFDGLTGCHNRTSTITVLEHLLAGSDATEIGVIFIDLDDFKPINDRYGHPVGDEVLVFVASRLRELTRSDDIVGRFGGDEFLLVCHGADTDEHLARIGERVRDAINQPVLLTVGTIDIHASVGTARWEPGLTASTLVAHADAAMYNAKHERSERQPNLPARTSTDRRTKTASP